MMLLSQEEIYEIIKPCGLGPQKSKAIKNLSKILVDEHDGKVPDDLASLEKLPGVGHKTASVVISQAFNIPAFPVDTHIHRCAQDGFINGRSVQQTERDLKKLFLQKNGINSIYKLLCMLGAIVLQEVVLVLNVRYARLATLIENQNLNIRSHK